MRDRRKAQQSVNQKESTPRYRRTAPERSHTRASCPPRNGVRLDLLSCPFAACCTSARCNLHMAHLSSLGCWYLAPFPCPFALPPPHLVPVVPFSRVLLSHARSFGCMRGISAISSRQEPDMQCMHVLARPPGIGRGRRKVDVAGRFHFPATVFGAFSYVVGQDQPISCPRPSARSPVHRPRTTWGRLDSLVSMPHTSSSSSWLSPCPSLSSFPGIRTRTFSVVSPPCPTSDGPCRSVPPSRTSHIPHPCSPMRCPPGASLRRGDTLTDLPVLR